MNDDFGGYNFDEPAKIVKQKSNIKNRKSNN